MRGLALEPSFDELVLFTRWVTPAQLRRRFDARFFLARLPGLQTIHPQEGEVTDWRWLSPRRALETADVTLVYATRAILESVADERDATTLFGRAQQLRRTALIGERFQNGARRVGDEVARA